MQIVDLNKWKKNKLRMNKMETNDDTKKIFEEVNNYKTYEEKARYLRGLVNYNSVSTPIVRIVRKLGFKLYSDNLRDDLKAYGMIGVDDSLEQKFGTKQIIILDKNDDYYHQRFVIAHELAHYIYDYSYNKPNSKLYETYKGQLCKTDEEKRANFFAACILMPEKEFEKQYKKCAEQQQDKIKKLSLLFEVPAESVERRIEELDLVI